MLFSQALWYNKALQFNAYSIPTSKVKSFGQQQSALCAVVVL
jgi:hypothetical protein